MIGGGAILHSASELRARITPRLEQLRARIARDFPGVVVTLDAHTVGRRDAPGGFVLGLSCRLPNVDPRHPDEVALVIQVSASEPGPMLEAEICWGDPSGQVEASLLPVPMACAVDATGDLAADLPRLETALIAALQRGHPQSAGHQLSGSR